MSMTAVDSHAPSHGVPTLADFEDAAATPSTASSRARRSTARSTSPTCSACPVHLKLENLQRTGSFKIRGADLPALAR